MTRSFDHLVAAEYLTTPDSLAQALGQTGLAFIDLGQAPTVDDMLGLAHQLGTPVQETTPLVLAHSDPTGRVVRITSRLEPSTIMAERVLSTSDMGMHLDHALAPIDTQPRYVLLGCETPPRQGSGGQTLIAPMAPLLNELTISELYTLATSYPRIIDPNITTPGPAASTFLRTKPDGTQYFSYWDAGEYGEAWDLLSPNNLDPEDVKRTIEKVRAITERHALSVPWKIGRIAIWDNHQYVHGRTDQVAPSDRSLLRVKVLTH